MSSDEEYAEERVIEPGFSLPLNGTEKRLLLVWFALGLGLWAWNLASWFLW